MLCYDSFAINITNQQTFSLVHFHFNNYASLQLLKTRNSSADERANVNFLYDDIVHALGNKKRRTKQTVEQSIKFTSLVESPQLPNQSLSIIDSRINSATGLSQNM